MACQGSLVSSPLVFGGTAGSAGLLPDKTVETSQSIGVEFALVDGIPNGAIRLFDVTAIHEAALLRKSSNLWEDLQYGLLTRQQSYLTQTRSIDDQSTVGKLEEFATRGHMTSPVVGLPNRPGALTLFA